MKRRVAVVAQRPSDFVEMRRAAVALAERGHAVTILYNELYGADRENELVVAELRDLESRGLLQPSVILRPEGSKPAAVPRARPGRRTGLGMETGLGVAISRGIRLARAPWRALVRLLGPLRRQVDRIRRGMFVPSLYVSTLSRFRRILGQLRPEILVLPEDVVGLVTPLVIRAGHDLGIPSLILPYTICNQEEAFRSLRSQAGYRFDLPPNRIAGRLFPHWVMVRDGDAVVRLPAPYIVGHVLTRTDPPDPWMMNSGYANRIAVENAVMFDYYRRAGIPASKMEVVGAVYDDVLAAHLRDRERGLAGLRREMGWTDPKPLLLVGGCPDQLSGGGAPGFDFEDLEGMVAHVVDCLGPLRAHYRVLVRPHPNFARLGEMFEAHGIPSTSIETARLVALSDAYVAFASATIRWSISCGIPTVNYDAFHYDYDDFKRVPGVLHAASPEDFRAAASRLAPAHPGFEALRLACRRERVRWSFMDGRSVERIEGLIERLCSLERVPRTVDERDSSVSGRLGRARFREARLGIVTSGPGDRPLARYLAARAGDAGRAGILIGEIASSEAPGGAWVDRSFDQAVARRVRLHPPEPAPPGGRCARWFLPSWRFQSQAHAFREDHRLRLEAAIELLTGERITTLVVFEDGISGNAWLVAAARRLGLRIVDVPYGYGTSRDLENDLARKEASGSILYATGPEGELVRKRHPQWVKKGRFEGAVMFPPLDILARESLGITLEDAWIIHGGVADVVCVESPRMFDHYRAEGVPERKLVVTGSPYCDVMHEALEADGAARDAFLRSRRIDPGRTRVLVSWPPSYHAERAGLCPFPTYRALVEGVLGCLRALPGVDLTVSLHPAIPAEDRGIFDELGIRGSSTYVVEDIPRHDVFVSCFSSTIRWAIAAGKPVLNFDFYGFDLPDYADAPGVVTMRDEAAFRDRAREWTSDPAAFARAAQEQVRVASRWGSVDGRAFERILRVLEERSAEGDGDGGR